MTSIISNDARATQAYIRKAEESISNASANLASGKKLNANVADLSVGTVLATRVSTLRTANQNAAQGASLVNIAKGGYSTINTLLQKQKSLSVKSNDASLGATERGFLNQEFQALKAEIDRIATNTTFNGKKLIDGSLSGSANVSSATSETTQNYSLLATSDYTLKGTVGSGYLATSSTFAAVSQENVGDTRGSTILAFTGTAGGGNNANIRVGDGANSTDITFTWGDAGTTAQNSAAAAAAFVTAAANNISAVARQFTYVNLGNGTVSITATNAGTLGSNALSTINDTTFTMTNDGGDGLAGGTGLLLDNVFLGGDNIVTDSGGGGLGAGGAESINSSNAAYRTLGANRTDTDATWDAALQGKFSNFEASYVQGAGGDSNGVIFTVTVNDKQYVSQKVSLTGYSGINNRGNTIAANQQISFSRSDGRQNSSGTYTDNAFTLKWGESTTISGTTVTEANLSLDAIATSLGSQLANNTIVQDRNVGMAVVSAADDRIKSAIGTVFNGIQGYDAASNAQGDITLVSDGYTSDGSHGRIGAFTFDKDTGIMSTSIDGTVYTADLSTTSDPEATTGQGYLSGGVGSTAYNTSTKVFTFTNGTIVLRTASTADHKALHINLSNTTTSSLTLSTDDSVKSFTDALNNIFDVSASDSLSFQVGVAANDEISVALAGARTDDLYLDSTGNILTLDISTQPGAIAASNALDTAINLSVSLISDANATLSRLDSARSNNEIGIQNSESARSALLDTDYSSESTVFAESTVMQQAGLSMLAQSNSRVNQVLSLLRQ